MAGSQATSALGVTQRVIQAAVVLRAAAASRTAASGLAVNTRTARGPAITVTAAATIPASVSARTRCRARLADSDLACLA